MARIYGITIPAGIEIIYNKAIKMYDISVFCNVGRNPLFLTRKKKYQLKDMSKLWSVAYMWSTLSQTIKDLWYSAADVMGQNGYALYTEDQVYRLMNGIAGQATPSIHHQFKIGHIQIESPSDSCKVTENYQSPVSFPLSLKISYKADFTCDAQYGTRIYGDNFYGTLAFAKIYLKTLRFEGGQNIYENHVITLNFDYNWHDAALDIVQSSGKYGEWSVIIELSGVIGDLYFDNLFIEYDATVQNNDPFCDTFPSKFVQNDVGAGVTLESIYCPDSIS